MIRSSNIALMLRGIASINSALPGGIFDVVRGVKTQHYMIVSIVSDIPNITTSDGIRTRTARVELRLIGGSESTTSNDLYDIADIIQSEIDGVPCNKIFDVNGQAVEGILYDSNSGVLYDNTYNRPTLILDYLFTYIE